MAKLYFIQNQLGHYWGRGKCWVDGADASRVAAWEYYDEAINTLVELSAKDIELRGELLTVESESGRLSRLAVSDIPLPEGSRPLEELGVENDVLDPQVDSSDIARVSED